jgi:hypothetical protein
MKCLEIINNVVEIDEYDIKKTVKTLEMECY